jgi:D-lactate dehydrogenase (cytochrome)
MTSHVVRAREPRDQPSVALVDRSAEAVARHLEDAAHFAGGRADAVARPRTEAEVAGLLQASSRVLAIGAQSSVTGGATPAGGLVLSTERLTSIHEPGQDRIRVGAGVPLETLQKLLRPLGRWYAPVPTFTGAFVGGVVATNAAGAATFKYGTTRDWVEGLTVVLACGHVLDLERGQVRADGRDGLEVICPHGTRRFRPGTYRMPDVPKCSAGYFAAPDMDLVDLFVGSEGTLGVIVEATLRVLPAPPVVAFVLVPVESESVALALVDELRRASADTWRRKDPRGIDVAAIEHLDRRCLEILRDDGADRRNDLSIRPGTELVLIIQLELPAGTDASAAFDDIALALSPGAPDTALARFCRTLDRHGVLDDTELAMPGDERRAAQFLAFREAAPTGVNRRVGDAKRITDARIEKTAADMIVPFDRFGEMMRIYRDGYNRRGLDHAIWGHISDGNVHPNVIPRTYDDVLAGREVILEFGREVARLGGCPLAEHGVGRSGMKQALLRQLYGDDAIEEMRAIKRALDPEGKLAPGVIFDGPWASGPSPS